VAAQAAPPTHSEMEEKAVVRLISQYLHELGYEETLKSLQRER